MENAFRTGLTSVRTGSAEQGPHTWQNFSSKFRTGVLVFGKKKKKIKKNKQKQLKTPGTNWSSHQLTIDKR
jgi:hypothetical protein